MTNSEAKAQYEGAILNQLVKNAEKLAVIEFDLNQIKPKLDKIDNLEKRFDGLEVKFDGLEKKFDGLENKVDSLEGKVDKIYTALSTLRWLSITIGIGVLVNIFSQPILNRIF